MEKFIDLDYNDCNVSGRSTQEEKFTYVFPNPLSKKLILMQFK